MKLTHLSRLLPLASALLFAACGGGGGSGGGSAAKMTLEEASNGFGVLLPHRTHRLDAGGVPTAEILSIETLDDLINNVVDGNPVLAPTPWPVAAKLPNGAPGNHYLFVRFRQPIDVDSVLDRSGAAGSTQFGGAVTVTSVDAAGNAAQLTGRAFVGGWTVGTKVGEDGLLELEQWVALQDGQAVALADVNGDGVDDFDVDTKPGLGFPGTEGAFPEAATLLDPRTLVFLPDADGDLSTHEAFADGAQVRMALTNAVLATNGENLEQAALACATVGVDDVSPEVEVSAGQQPQIVPGNGDVDVDPETSVLVRFTEPIQPYTLGDLPTGAPPALSAAIRLEFGPSTALAVVPFTAAPVSVHDLSLYELRPVYPFPGKGPEVASCGTFSRVDVRVNPDTFEDLSANTNQSQTDTFFETGEGPGLVNAPVAPEAIYVGLGGSLTGLSVLDLNGFGQSTGDPAYSPECPWEEGSSNFPNNPNLTLLGPALLPLLNPGTCTIDGGSQGPFTLTRDTSLDTRLVRSPIVQSVGDMALGRALDGVFNNGSPLGCQSGGGNQCASTGFKRATFQLGVGSSFTLTGFENLLQFAPHPNPPPLKFPPTCIAPFIGGQEPTSVDSFALNGATNLLNTGLQPFGIPELCQPPDGLVSPTALIMPVWGGPSVSPPAPGGTCPIYTVRQQIGHFLYVIDRVAGELVVLNSNRMTVLERIQLPDPTSLAMSPNLDLLAVTNQQANTVSFVSVDPANQFHSVVKTVEVGKGPTGIAWEPGNEDILVCNTGENSVSIIAAAGLSVRKTVTNQLFSPIDVAITPRQQGHGFFRNVYFAYVLNANGQVSIFESGPDGVNGWGFDDVIGVLPMTFDNPKTIQPDPRNLNSAFWVVHENQLGPDGEPTGLGGGAVTNVAIVGGLAGQIPLDPGFFTDPQIRELQWGVQGSVGSDQLTGIPTDIAFDNWTNFTTFPNYATAFSAGAPKNHNAKGILFQVPTGGVTPASVPRKMFVAVPVSSEGPGVIDVIDIDAGFLRFDTNPFQDGVQSVPAPGARIVMDYFRQ